MRFSLRLLPVVAAAALLTPLLSTAASAHSLPEGVSEEQLAAQLDAARELVAAAGSSGEAGRINEPVSDGFELVGHDPLFARGMNAGLAVRGDYAYVGSRTDGSPEHEKPGILVVDVRDPASPQVVHEIGQPAAARIGETSRELRIWPEQDLLMVLNFGCSSAIHACTAGEVQDDRITFFDIAGEKAAAPELVSTYTPSRTPHEFFLWVDPAAPADRALLFSSTPTSSTSRPNMIVTDISQARDGEFTETAEWVATFDSVPFENGEREDRRLHSLGVSNDGKRAYLSFLGAGFLVLDTTDVALGKTDPVIDLITPPQNRARWSNPGAHTSVKIPGTDSALTTDEVYGDALDALGPHGCPWGWVRTLDISDEATPRVTAEYKVEQNTPEYCESGEGSDPANTLLTSYSAHNPTLTPDLAFVTWHSVGLEAISLSDPTAPRHVGNFSPEPLPSVTTEDPALSTGRNKVVMWSYPIVQDGLIYVVDIRNGLYILRYTGEGAADVAEIDFLEGNSNLGDALRFEDPAAPRARSVTDACPIGAVPDSGRTDADGNTHERAIDCMVWWGIANGVSATEYDVAGSVTRGQMASFLARLVTSSGGALPGDGPDAFGDDSGTTHEPSINALAAAGLVNGKDGGRFGVDEPVTRGQMAALLVRTYEFVSDRTLTADRSAFSDDDGTTHEADIDKAVAAGFAVGQDGRYGVAQPVQRDQMASFLARTLDLLVHEGTTPAKATEEPPAEGQ